MVGFRLGYLDAREAARAAIVRVGCPDSGPPWTANRSHIGLTKMAERPKAPDRFLVQRFGRFLILLRQCQCVAIALEQQPLQQGAGSEGIDVGQVVLRYPAGRVREHHLEKGPARRNLGPAAAL